MSTDIIVKVVPGGLMAANAIEADKIIQRARAKQK